MGLLFKSTGIILMYFSQPLGLFLWYLSVMLQAPSNYVLIPAASLPRLLRGIHRGSVDAVSDTFRFLPFIFPTHTVALLSCWCMLLKPAIFLNTERKEEELWRQIIAPSFITNYKHTNEGKVIFLVPMCVVKMYLLPITSLSMCWIGMYLNIQIHCTDLRAKH